MIWAEEEKQKVFSDLKRLNDKVTTSIEIFNNLKKDSNIHIDFLGELENIHFISYSLKEVDIKNLYYSELKKINPLLVSFVQDEMEESLFVKSKYWNLIGPLRDAYMNSSEISLEEEMKILIMNKIIDSINGDNYLIARLLIDDNIDRKNLINFLFQSTLNIFSIYKLFKFHPERYYSRFMFKLSGNELPDINRYLGPDYYDKIARTIDLDVLYNRINSITLKELQILFPKAYKSGIISNPYLKNIKD